jgi:hypothetical protein
MAAYADLGKPRRAFTHKDDLGAPTASCPLLPSFVGFVRDEADADMVFANVIGL